MNEKYLVTKANTLITSHYNLSLEESKIILTLISQVQPEDEDFKPYQFKISKFIKLLGVQDQSKYTEIPKITKELMKKVFEIKQGNSLFQVAWLCGVKYDKISGMVEIEFSPYLKPYLLNLKKLFTRYSVKYILKLTSKYSIRLYELMKCHEYKNTVKVELIELSDMLKLSQRYEYFDIKRKVIEPSKKELEEKTDIIFDYEPIKTGKRVTALRFTINPNLKNKNDLEPTKQLALVYNEPLQVNGIKTIQAIKDEFRRLYKAELVDRFVKEMLKQKGLEYVQECIRNYGDYIKGQEIKNIGGHFKTFVMEGYEKPVQRKGKVPQRDNFDQREYSEEELENCYANFQDEPQPPKKPYEQVKGHIDNMRNAASKTNSEDSIKGD